MDYSFNICLKNRQLLEGILNRFTLEQLNKIPEGFSNNMQVAKDTLGGSVDQGMFLQSVIRGRIPHSHL
mgnify:CR=1 FL=1